MTIIKCKIVRDLIVYFEQHFCREQSLLTARFTYTLLLETFYAYHLASSALAMTGHHWVSPCSFPGAAEEQGE